MRKLFISTKSAWLASFRACHFHPVAGSPYIDLGNGLILVAAVFNGEHGEEEFTAHPEVAALPDPVFEGRDLTMAAYRDNPAKKYSHEHHAALVSSLGVTDSNTVLEVSKKAEARCKSVKIGHII